MARYFLTLKFTLVLSFTVFLVNCSPPPDPEELIDLSTPILAAGNQFTAATWNVRQATAVTMQGKVSVLPVGVNKTPTKNDSIFAFLDKFSIEIVALQELHSNTGAIPMTPKNGFLIIPGKKINENANLGPAYCAVAYKEDVFDCSDHGTGWEKGGRKTHWVKCTFDSEKLKPLPQRKKLYYGCSHYSTKGSEQRANIRGFFESLDNTDPNKKPKRPTVKKGVAKDNFILGMDANSYMHGVGKRKWKRYYKEWRDRNKPITQDIVFAETRPKAKDNGFTKFSKNGIAPNQTWGIPAINSRIVDELIWSLDNKITYIPGSKQIVPVGSLRSATAYPIAHKDVNAFWISFHKLSDHIPVKAEFRY